MTGREAGGTLDLRSALVGFYELLRGSHHTEQFLTERVSRVNDIDLFLGFHRVNLVGGGGGRESPETGKDP